MRGFKGPGVVAAQVLLEGAVIEIFASALYEWVSSQDKQVIGRLIVPLFFFLAFVIPYILLLSR